MAAWSPCHCAEVTAARCFASNDALMSALKSLANSSRYAGHGYWHAKAPSFLFLGPEVRVLPILATASDCVC